MLREETADALAELVPELTELLAKAQSHLANAPSGQLRSEADVLQGIYRLRRIRDALFDGNQMFGATRLFGEPAWDLLLEIAVAELSGRDIATNEACRASCAPLTTGLRYVDGLRRAGLIHRVADPTDDRRIFLRLSSRGRELVERFARTVSEEVQAAPSEVGR